MPPWQRLQRTLAPAEKGCRSLASSAQRPSITVCCWQGPDRRQPKPDRVQENRIDQRSERGAAAARPAVSSAVAEACSYRFDQKLPASRSPWALASMAATPACTCRSFHAASCRVLHLALAGLGCWQRLPQAVGNWFRCTRYQLQLGHALRYRSFIHVCFLASGFMLPQLSLTSCTSASLVC